MSVEYRVFFDDEPVRADTLARLEEIVVEQEIDKIWEARLTVPQCLGPEGKWDTAVRVQLGAGARIRIEVKVRDRFVCLIDGPVVGIDAELSGQPGRSAETVIVMDDSVYMNRKRRAFRHEDRALHEIASDLFRESGHVADSDVDPPVDDAPSHLPREVVQHHTDIEILRCLAATVGRHAYVLPTDTPGRSKGFFRRPTDEPGDLPPLVLNGAGRNITELSATADYEQPARVVSSRFDVGERTVLTRTARYRDVAVLGQGNDLLREDKEDEESADVPPDSCGADIVEPRERAEGDARRRALFISATGSTLDHCYGGVLRPYERVTVSDADRLTGSFFIERVTHHLGRSRYRQEFALKRDGFAPPKDKAALPGNLF